MDHFGPIMTVAIMTGFAVTLITYAHTMLFGKPHRVSGSFFYDLFMGVVLNPRIAHLDLKMWSEIRYKTWLIQEFHGKYYSLFLSPLR